MVTETTEPPELTASWPGVTADTIRLGFIETDIAELREMGLVDIDFGDPELVMNALVDELNSRGGILGRQVEVFQEFVLPIDPVAAEATCVRLTDELNVFAVLGAFVGPVTDVNPCITGFGETIMVGGNPTPAELEEAVAPWVSTGMAAERRLRAGVHLMEGGGLLGARIGVVWAPNDEGAARSLVIPELVDLGYEVVMEAAQTAPSGDRLALADEWAVLIERLELVEADTVVLVESAAGFNGSNQLTLQGWPGQVLIVDTVSTIGSIGSSGETPPEDLERIVGTMGPSAQEAFDLEESQECIEIVETAHPDILVHASDQVPAGEPDWAQTVLTMCARLRLFEMIAVAAGPELTQETFVAGAESLGKIQLPQIPFSSLGPGKLDASDSLRLGRFDASIDEDGGASPAGPLTP